MTEQNYTDFLNAFGSEPRPKVSEMYSLSTFNATASISDAVVTATTYILTRAGMICRSQFVLRSAEFAGFDAFGYRFNYTPSCPRLLELNIDAFPNKNLAPNFGATNTSELPYVFANLDNMPFNRDSCNSTAKQYEMSSQLVAARTAMISGNPSTSSFNRPRYTSKDDKGVVVNDEAFVAELDF